MEAICREDDGPWLTDNALRLVAPCEDVDAVEDPANAGVLDGTLVDALG